MFGLDVLTLSSLLVMTAGGGVQCTLPKPPSITVNPTTNEVRYNFKQDAQTLGKKKSGTVSPYGPGHDTTTGGLRQDQPETTLQVQWGVVKYPDLGVACLYYDSVKINIELNPTIYIAKDYINHKKCKAAILDHERDHVRVDRKVVNKYAKQIGLSVKKAVDGIGVIGPIRVEDVEATQKQLVDHVRNAATAHDRQISEEMQSLQSRVDSLEEYQRISEICNN
ncbi:MAG: hypothetical protein H6868_04890 [Rhodospirillales bacterium]|nr:hypothetical protein [Rhodospirillales bacterium]